MSEKYKTDSKGLYFVSFSVVGWLDVFTRREYQDILTDIISYCQLNKNLKIYCYCIMPSHVHFISYSENKELSDILRDLKAYTAKQLINAIKENPQESRKEFLLNQFKYYGKMSPQKQTMQFWKHDNHPFYLYSNKMIQQKVDYIHFNPVNAGFVNYPYEWRLSSANEQSQIKLNERI
ncbi:MAG: transposase [Bacteroidetes bacterium]|nr:transposase [Bacteroidota bacterium]HET6245655.1 transposase [Bacteroidia bacterium]